MKIITSLLGILAGVTGMLYIQEQQQEPPPEQQTKPSWQVLDELYLGNPKLAERAARDRETRDNPLVHRTLEFLLHSDSAEEALAAAFDLMPSQKEEIEKLTEDLKAGLKQIDKDRDKLVAEYQRKNGNTLSPDAIIRALKNRRRQEVKQEIASMIMVEQRELILGWDPDEIGIAKTLTETPIGSAIGLTDTQKAKIRREANRIGQRVWEEWWKARQEAAELFDDVLTEEQRKQIRDLYYQGASSEMPFLPSTPNEIVYELTYENPTKKK